MDTIEVHLLSAAILLIVCVLVSKATGKIGIPTLVVFLVIGMLAGSEGIGRIHFDDAYASQSLGIIALSYILFSGGLDTKLSSIKPVLKSGIALSTAGVLFTCLLMGTFIHFILGFELLESFLIGAIISSTDAGAVFTVLRGRNIHLKGSLKPLLELESGSNDPMAVFLTTSILQLMQNKGALSFPEMIPLFFQQMALGLIMGFLLAKAFVWLFTKLKLEVEGLYLVLSIGLVILIYSTTQSLNGNGFLAVYVAGVVMGNHTFVLKKSLAMMHDGISWLMQGAMFLTLGLLIYPSKVISVTGQGVLIASFMILFARPISIFITMSLSKFSFREKLLVSWVGLRGSVPIILATYPLVAGINRADLIFNLVFFVALISLLVQGTSIPYVSKLLKVDDPLGEKIRHFPSTPGNLKDILTIDIHSKSPVIGKSVVDLHLTDENVLIVAIERSGEVIIPRGSTIIEANDKISVMAEDESLDHVVEIFWEDYQYKHQSFFSFTAKKIKDSKAMNRFRS
ncbi:MAG: potassium/proton antiporter [Bacteriovoracia bacterium]